jgi:hypothetical protein
MPESIEFTRSIYLPEAVQAAADAFSDLARIEVSVSDDVVNVELSELDPDFEDSLADEFANHALHETIVRTRSGE